MSATYTYDYLSARNRESVRRFVSHDFFSEKVLQVRSVNDAIIAISPTGGIVSNGGILPGSMVHTFWIQKKFRWIPKQYVMSDDEVLFLGVFNCCWGHCITDNLKHLWVLDSLFIDKYKKLKWVYVLEDPALKLPHNFVEILEALGAPIERLTQITEPTLFRCVHIPDSSFFSDEATTFRYYTKEYAKTIERIVSSVQVDDSNSDRQVYLTRSGWKKNRIDFGERTVELAFAQRGFEIVHPELLDLRGIITLMQHCSHLASTEGSCAHNSIFMRKGSKVTFIRKANYVNEYQPPLNQALGLNISYVDANRSFLLETRSCPFAGPFFVCCNKNLALLLKVRTNVSIVEFLCYVWCYLKMQARRIARKMNRGLDCIIKINCK